MFAIVLLVSFFRVWFFYPTVKVACSTPPSIHNALHDGPPEALNHELGTMLQYECMPNYVLNRDAVVRAWCVGGGVWVGPNMTCTSKSKISTRPPSVNGKFPTFLLLSHLVCLFISFILKADIYATLCVFRFTIQLHLK